MAKKSFPLRIDEDIFDDLRRWAEDEFRSVNGQIEYLLREALRQSGRFSDRTSAVDRGGKPAAGSSDEPDGESVSS